MQSVIERIKKLLSLATSDNENEARLAATMASELITKHNLNMSALNTAQDYCREVLATRNRANPADKFINALISKYFFVTVIKSTRRLSGTTYIVLGTKENVEIASYVSDFLQRAFVNAFKDSKLPAKERSGFYYGLFKGLSEQLETNRTKVQNEMGLVVVPDAGLKAYVNSEFRVKAARTVSVRSSAEAVEAGREQGRNMRIAKGISSSSNNGLRLKA